MKIGKIIRQKRRSEDISQAELAAIIGVHKGAVWGWEKNITFPKGEYLLELIRIFDINLSEFPWEKEFPRRQNAD